MDTPGAAGQSGRLGGGVAGAGRRATFWASTGCGSLGAGGASAGLAGAAAAGRSVTGMVLMRGSTL